MKIADLIFAVVGLLLCAYIWISSAEFPQDVVMKIGPDFFPRMLVILMAIACITLIVQALVRKTAEKAESLSLKDKGIQRAIIVLVSSFVYVAIMEMLGFIPATVIFMMFMMLILNMRNWLRMFMVSLGTAVVVNMAFSGLLDIQLPYGILAFILE